VCYFNLLVRRVLLAGAFVEEKPTKEVAGEPRHVDHISKVGADGSQELLYQHTY
jgi:hypothetical protein